MDMLKNEIRNNEKGITLVEVLTSITLLSIVLITALSIFPQMGRVNNLNETKAQATNIAKEVLISWKDSDEVKVFIINPNQTAGFVSTKPSLAYTNFNSDYDFYYFDTTRDDYDVKITIKKDPDKQSKKSSVHHILVQLFNSKGNKVGESFGYIKTYGFIGR
ncbi:MAG: prepilin-type N-terminal cleavage/methylation domain-containing protein [Neobacillus sp.]